MLRLAICALALICSGCLGGSDFKDCSDDDTCSACTPTSCEAEQVACGPLEDGCGTMLDCGPCPPASSIRSVPINARSIVADRLRGKIYATVPSTEGPDGNSIAVIDAASATVERTFFVGSEPSQLALSADGDTLWVGLDGAESLARVDVASGEVVETQALVGSPVENRVQAIVVSPLDPSKVVVAIGTGSSVYALAAFQHGVQLGESNVSLPGRAFAFAEDGTTLYGAGTFGELTTYKVDENGIVSIGTVRDALDRDVDSMVLANGRLHCSNGRIYDLALGRLAGTLQAAGLFDHEPESARSYFVPWSLSSSSEKPVIRVFSTETFVPIDTVDLATGRSPFLQSRAVARYADDGLAILVDHELWLVRSGGL